MTTEVIAVVGGKWGDEGKGKIIDLLAENADVVIRPTGGANAGHTIKNHLGNFANHLMPGGIFNPDVDNIIGNNVAFNPQVFLSELDTLHKASVPTERVYISPRASLTLGFHQYLDGQQEQSKGDEYVGTTKQGIGPTYMDKAERVGLRTSLLKDPSLLMNCLAKVLARKTALYFPRGEVPEQFKPEYYEEMLKEACQVLGPMVQDTDRIINCHLDKGSRIILEGAQGTLLDVTYGTYPNVTSSGCTVMGLMEAAKIPPQNFSRSIGVFKAYDTKVGNGGFPSRMSDDLEARIREKGQEFGTTTGRERMVGWFDGVAAEYAQEINRFTDWVLLKGDVLTGEGPIYICRQYHDPKVGFKTNQFPLEDRDLQRYKPSLVNDGDLLPGWDEDFQGATKWEDLPQEFIKYVSSLFPHVPGARLAYIGTGPRREDGVNLFL